MLRRVASGLLLLLLVIVTLPRSHHPSVRVVASFGPVSPVHVAELDPTSTTTTTTLARADQPPSPPSARGTSRTGGDTVPSSGEVNGYPCGGDLPPCWVLRRESGGNPTAVNRTGCSGRTCGGLWQFDPRTWNGFGGYAYAQDAPADVQNEKARLTWAGGSGCSHWAAC